MLVATEEVAAAASEASRAALRKAKNFRSLVYGVSLLQTKFFQFYKNSYDKQFFTRYLSSTSPNTAPMHTGFTILPDIILTQGIFRIAA